MSALSALLMALGRAGVELAPHPTHPAWLRHRPAVLPPDLSARLRLHRVAILGPLAGGYAPAGNDAGFALGERLGVADGLGMSTHPGVAAWLVAAGKSLESCCQTATFVVQCGHGPTDEGNCGGGEGERSDSGGDRQGRGRGP